MWFFISSYARTRNSAFTERGTTHITMQQPFAAAGGAASAAAAAFVGAGAGGAAAAAGAGALAVAAAANFAARAASCTQ